MPAELPSCECIGSYPRTQKLAYIYGQMRRIAEDTTLPPVECVVGESENQIMNRIYCAAVAWRNL